MKSGRYGSKLLLLASWFGNNHVKACSDILVTPGASADGSAMIAYNADDVSLYGVLYHYPPTQGKEGEMLKVYDWDTGVSTRTQYCTVLPVFNNPCRIFFLVLGFMTTHFVCFMCLYYSILLSFERNIRVRSPK
jgi:hypothetical protein